MIARAVDAEFEPGVVLRDRVGRGPLRPESLRRPTAGSGGSPRPCGDAGTDLDWIAIIERLSPLAEAKGAPSILERVESLRRQFSG
jgi:hypothetical protein